MKIRILGCYGSVTRYHRTTSFLVNDSLLLDAGTVSEALSADELRKITCVLVSHAHMDHIKGLFAFVDDLFLLGSKGITLAAVQPVLDVISANLFNGKVYPDLTRIPSAEAPIVSAFPLRVGKGAVFDGVEVKPVRVAHTVACTGFVVKEGGRGFMFTADSGPTRRFWEVAREEQGLEFIMADVSFPNRMKKLALKTGHMTLAMLQSSLHSYGLQDKTVYITHMKPLFSQEIIREVAAAGERNIRLLEQESTITV
jgi:ribonuclease BN (tRNA processing enzyme)